MNIFYLHNPMPAIAIIGNDGGVFKTLNVTQY